MIFPIPRGCWQTLCFFRCDLLCVYCKISYPNAFFDKYQPDKCFDSVGKLCDQIEMCIRDRAGAYAIQGRGAKLVRDYSGDYTNIVGLPAWRVLRVLCGFGKDIPF